MKWNVSSLWPAALPFLLAACSSFPSSSSFDDVCRDPVKVTQQFYDRFIVTNEFDAYSEEKMSGYSVYLSAELYQLIMDAIRRDKAYLAANPGNKGRFGDGVPFYGSADGISSAKVIAPAKRISSEVNAVTLTLDMRNDRDDIAWRDAVALSRASAGSCWQIDNVIFDEDTNTSSLQDILRDEEE